MRTDVTVRKEAKQTQEEGLGRSDVVGGQSDGFEGSLLQLQFKGSTFLDEHAK